MGRSEIEAFPSFPASRQFFAVAVVSYIPCSESWRGPCRTYELHIDTLLSLTWLHLHQRLCSHLRNYAEAVLLAQVSSDVLRNRR